jgi:hypothetical protein
VRKHITYANVVSTLCLFIVLGGGAFAATKLPKNSVTSNQIKNGAIKGSDIAKSAITGANVKNGTLLASDFNTSSLPTALRGEQGPAGPPGQNGTSGITNLIVRATASSPGTNTAIATCLPGEQAISGGGGTSPGNPLLGSAPQVSGPGSVVGRTPDSWQISTEAPSPQTAFVVCASP